MKNASDLPVMSFANWQDWEAWLNERHADTKGVWLKIAKNPETRSARIQKFIEMLSNHQKLYP